MASSNIVHLEHVNVRQPDQRLATLFYVVGLGLTRDPYLMVGLDNMWINAGRNQVHLPTGNPQRVRGTIGLVIPNLNALRERLQSVAPDLSQTLFVFADGDNCIEAICPWGNRFRCHEPAPEFGPKELAIPYVEFNVPAGTAERIARFYEAIMGAASKTGTRRGSMTASISTGRDQFLHFRETAGNEPPYDGHHVQIYIEDFSGPHRQLLDRGLITRDRDAYEWRFKDIVDVETNEVLFTLEHEVRDVAHPLYGRPLVNRNPSQSNREYIRGKDAFGGTF